MGPQCRTPTSRATLWSRADELGPELSSSGLNSRGRSVSLERIFERALESAEDLDRNLQLPLRE